MRRLLYIVILFTVGFSIGGVEKDSIQLHWNITGIFDANELISLGFEDCTFDENSQLPVYSKQIPLKNQNGNFEIVLENTVFKSFNFESKNLNLDQISTEINLNKSILQSGNSRILQIQFIPIIQKNNQLFFLESFDLKQIPVKSVANKTNAQAWKQSSVLKAGKWVKIKTAKKGLYKIPYSTLSEWGFANPENVRVFGSGGTQLSENPGEINYDDLNQSAVWHGNNNGTPCLFFYEPGTVKWSLNSSNSLFQHQANHYTNSGFFFLGEDQGISKIVTKNEAISEPATFFVNQSDAYQLSEVDSENLIFSGKQWFGQKFINGTTKSVSFDLDNFVLNSEVNILIQAASRSYINSKMAVKANSASLGDISFLQVTTSDNIGRYADLRSKQFTTTADGVSLDLFLNFQATGSGSSSDENAEAWLDFVEVNFKQKLQVGNKPLFFRDISSLGNGNVVEFTIANANSNTKILDVTDINTPREIPFQLTGNAAKIKVENSSLRELVVFNQDGEFEEPEWVADVENQNLHEIETPEFIIISHPNFLSAANELANFHRSYDGMSVEVVNAEKVYNEFSSGAKNATGIRNFIKMLYDRNDGLKYVLLFGDGSYDNKKILAESNNFIPTFQSNESLLPTSSFITDDYFVILDADESVYNGMVDLGIGRIPAATLYQAEIVVNKVLNYYNPETLGSWRNVICFIGDDEDGNLHMRDSDTLASKVNRNHKEFITDKIYLDAFLQESIAGVERYPEVTDAINKRVKEGVLVLNYVGHANDRFMADEHVLDVSNINSWSNANSLPIFVTATCEFSRFDGDETSAGEYVLFNPTGGGIGLFSTTRVVYAGPNFELSKNFYDVVFGKDENGNHYRMGDIIRLAKVKTIYGYRTNKRNFSLLADPALKLSYPENKVITTTINQHNATEIPDTIGALQKVTISGYIADNSGNKLNQFSGRITPTVFDKAVRMKTLGNGGETPMEFEVQENVIYKGVANVENGEFSFSFVIPKDISYKLGEGKIVYYAENGVVDAHGAFENFIIGGNSSNQIVDNSGPDIQLFMDSESFVSGDVTSKNPTLLAYLSDENGINTVGTGIGHDITAILDNDYSNVLVLNKYYQSNYNDYTSGILEFPFRNLSEGNHSLKLKAWDVANNSSEVEIEFYDSGEFVISGITNYPNPVTDYTYFTFEHNQSDATLDIIVEIFDQQGSRIDFFTTSVGSNGLNSNPVRWDIENVSGRLKGGIYFYRITAQNNDNLLSSKSGKFLIVR